MSPDFSIATKFADAWLPVEQGHDAAFWMAVNHVLLKEFYAEREVPFFKDYVTKYTDFPFLVQLTEKDGVWRQGELVRAAQFERSANLEHAEWCMCVADRDGSVRVPNGSLGTRWSKQEGNWNLEMKDVVDGGSIDPALTFLGG